MKASAPTLIPAAATDKGWVAVLSELVKARLTTLVLATTAVGFQMGLVGRNDWNLLLRTLLGTGCVAAAAAVLNQWMERDADARMLRTQDRPLPSGRIHPGTALVGGLVGALLGSVYLWFAVHPLTATLGLLTLLIYLLVYTPLKRITPWNTVVGAIPGALPPLMGWTAARGSLAIEGWSLFALLACWQLPHFLAIAWMFRDDYARGGFAMLPLHDPTGRRTSTQAVGHTVALIGVSLLPTALGLTSQLYLGGALGLGALFLGYALRFQRAVSLDSARRLFWVSILYLPALLGLMLATRTS
jgi:heme o synthase